MKDSNIGRVFYDKINGKDVYVKAAFLNTYYGKNDTYFMEVLTNADVFGDSGIEKCHWQESYSDHANLLELDTPYVNWDIYWKPEAKKVKDTKLARKMYADNILLEIDGFLIISE